MTMVKRLYVVNGQITIRLVPELAVEIGFHESIVLLQIDFLLSIKGEILDDSGIRWVRQSVRELQAKSLYFWSIATVGRTLSDLVERGLLITRPSVEPSDTTLWYSYGPECLLLKSAILTDTEEIARPSKPKAKKPEAKDPTIYDIAVALATVCNMDFNMNKGRMLKEAKSLAGKTPEQIIALFGQNSPWYTSDFRGQKGSPPSPTQVKSEWIKMEKTGVVTPSKIVKSKDGGAYI